MADPTSIPGLGGIPGDLPRHGGGRLPARSRPGPALERKSDAPVEAVGETAPAPATDPTTALIQALDRLRATEGLRPVETELVRAMRGARYYQEETRHDLPVLDAPAQPRALPPDQLG